MADSSPLVVLAPHALLDYSGRPQRFMDAVPTPAQARALVGAWFQNDEQLECDYHRKQCGEFRRLKAALRLILRNYAALRRARMIYCLDGMYYTVLLLLSRYGLFRTEGKIIRRLAFHDSAWQKLAPRLASAAPAFQVECITQEQLASATGQLGAKRVVFRPWKIDAAWFQPADDVPKTRALLPGNISRDESIVAPLLQRGLSITRVARSESLHERFALEIANPRFELVTNASHQAYLELLHSAPAVLLPIVSCDGSAGLTAALEAIAAGVPVLANRSMGLTELFAECQYPVPMLKSLEPDAWTHAYRQVEEWHESSEFIEALEHSRDLLLKNHRILPAGEDWTQIYTTACAAAESPAVELHAAASPA